LFCTVPHTLLLHVDLLFALLSFTYSSVRHNHSERKSLSRPECSTPERMIDRNQQPLHTDRGYLSCCSFYSRYAATVTFLSRNRSILFYSILFYSILFYSSPYYKIPHFSFSTPGSKSRNKRRIYAFATLAMRNKMC
jgi:hypothetical protein